MIRYEMVEDQLATLPLVNEILIRSGSSLRQLIVSFGTGKRDEPGTFSYCCSYTLADDVFNRFPVVGSIDCFANSTLKVLALQYLSIPDVVSILSTISSHHLATVYLRYIPINNIEGVESITDILLSDRFASQTSIARVHLNVEPSRAWKEAYEGLKYNAECTEIGKAVEKRFSLLRSVEIVCARRSGGRLGRISGDDTGFWSHIRP